MYICTHIYVCISIYFFVAVSCVQFLCQVYGFGLRFSSAKGLQELLVLPQTTHEKSLKQLKIHSTFDVYSPTFQ